MSGAQLLWRRANLATLKALRGEYKGQFHIILGKTDPITEFFTDLPRKVEGEKTRIDIWTEPVPEGEEESPPWRLIVRRNSPAMKRADEWYISSQQPGSGHPRWGPGVGPLAETEAETDYAVLLRTSDDRFYAGWLRDEQVASLPLGVREGLAKSKVGSRALKADEAQAILVALGQEVEVAESEADSPREEEQELPPVDSTELEKASAQEGQPRLVQHFKRERNTSLRRKRVAQAGKRLICEACGFDFEAVYGERGHGFIECHHKIPLPEVDPATPTRLKDLALLCANCHRMIHRRRPWLEVEELKELLSREAGTK